VWLRGSGGSIIFLLPALLNPPLVFAHRGGAALRPENTIAAFDHGLSLGADGLEFDVHLSRDGVVVVHHDSTLERTTSGRGRLADHTADELAALDAGFRFVPAGAADGECSFRGQGIGVPRLAAVLARYPGIPIIIELKGTNPALARRVIDDLRAAASLDRVALGGFSQAVLRAARKYEPSIRTGAGREETRWALYRSWIGWAPRRPAYTEFQVPEASGGTRIVSRRFVDCAHRAGLPIHVWTVNDADAMRRLLEWGVDGLITDRPDTALAQVRGMRV
jgi:glycerophosphoryl diester phosphodiesterase